MAKNKSKNRQKPKKKYTDPNRAKRLTKGTKNDSLSPSNPFEMRVNKQKHVNLGRVGKHERGLPGVSRGKAIEKRKATLLLEYKVRNKSSVLMDKRIGEKNKDMPEDEKLIRRSTMEKVRQYKKKSIFSLHDDDEILTHKGKSLSHIDRYDDPREESDSEDERLNEEFVSDANFSGFMRMKKKESETEEQGEKSRQEIIAELIQNTKQRKLEKAKESDELFELREKLDQEFKNPNFKNLLIGISSSKHNPVDVPTGKSTGDYDRLVKELQFESKTGCAANRKKTEDEIAMEEKAQLEKMEKDRIKRMIMSDQSNPNSQHRSADDLNDGFDLNDESTTLSYGLDGRALLDPAHPSGSNQDFDDYECFSNYTKNPSLDHKNKSNEKHNSADLKIENFLPKSGLSKSKKQQSQLQLENVETTVENEIPFVLKLPELYSDFVKILKIYGAHCSSTDQSKSTIKLKVLLERLIQYNRAANKPNMWMLFCHILRYFFDTVFHWKTFSNKMIELCEICVPQLHAIMVLQPSRCCDEFYKLLESARSMFEETNTTNYPMIFVLQVCPLMFCSTDFRHQIFTPAVVFLSQLLSEYKVVDFESVGKLVYLCATSLEFYNESKRYNPESPNVLLSILLCFCPKSPLTLSTIAPSIRPAIEVLHLNDKDYSKVKLSSFREVMVQSNTDDTPSKLALLSRVLDLTVKFISLYESLPSAVELAAPFKMAIEEIKKLKLPEQILAKIDNLLSIISSLKVDRRSLKVNDQKPKPLKLYEPLIEENFDGVRRKKGDKKKQEQARLMYKIKQETRSAVREIKLDNAFLAKQQLKETMDKDAERKRKVKELLGSLANQEGDYQKLKKIK